MRTKLYRSLSTSNLAGQLRGRYPVSASTRSPLLNASGATAIVRGGLGRSPLVTNAASFELDRIRNERLTLELDRLRRQRLLVEEELRRRVSPG